MALARANEFVQWEQRQRTNMELGMTQATALEVQVKWFYHQMKSLPFEETGMDGVDVPALLGMIDKQVQDCRMQMHVVMYSDLDPTMKYVVGCQVVQLFEDIDIYKRNMMEKNKTIRNKSQIGRNVPEESEKSSPENVGGQADNGEAKVVCDTVYTEDLAKEKPTRKFERAAFAKYVQLRKDGAIMEPAMGKAGK